VLEINDLWDSCDEREWLAALGGSWPTLVGSNDPELAKSVQTVYLESIRRLGIQDGMSSLAGISSCSLLASIFSKSSESLTAAALSTSFL